jgi:hypothetical protein
MQMKGISRLPKNKTIKDVTGHWGEEAPVERREG